MGNVSTILFPILLADDTNIFVNGKDIDAWIVKNKDLKKNVFSLSVKKLSLDIKKTHYIVFMVLQKMLLKVRYKDEIPVFFILYIHVRDNKSQISSLNLA